MNSSRLNSQRSVSPTPRSMGAKIVDSRRYLSTEDKKVLRSMMVDEKDVDLIKMYFETFKGNLNVKYA